MSNLPEMPNLVNISQLKSKHFKEGASLAYCGYHIRLTYDPTLALNGFGYYGIAPVGFPEGRYLAAANSIAEVKKIVRKKFKSFSK